MTFIYASWPQTQYMYFQDPNMIISGITYTPLDVSIDHEGNLACTVKNQTITQVINQYLAIASPEKSITDGGAYAFVKVIAV
jgi:hypothetical protein